MTGKTVVFVIGAALAVGLAGCADEVDDDDLGSQGVGDDDTSDDDAGDDDVGDDDASDDDAGDDDDTWSPGPCDFGYDEMFGISSKVASGVPARSRFTDGSVAHAEPPPPYTYTLSDRHDRDLVMPGYSDDMPLFERGQEWLEEMRCFELPAGEAWLTEAEAFDLYREIAETTTGVEFVSEPNERTVVGFRGAFPGTFAWHGNDPDVFNDTLVLLWEDGGGGKYVREFHAHTDVGDRDFGFESSSSLRPNRRYWYYNGWHSDYNALHIGEWGYRVRDDTNNNGHWDSDRNGWLPPQGEDDYDRTGSGHNIHLASVDGPVGEATVGGWSAGCQTIPGMANWTEFIVSAWTEEDEYVQYFLLDARDIAPQVWTPCTPDGSHACPFPVDPLDDEVSGDTTGVTTSEFDLYNCSTADESGPEVVYVFTLDTAGTLHVEVDCDDPFVDIDIHLLDGDDPDACLARGHWELDYEITEGRYFIVADTYVEDGVVLDGAYTVTVELL
jgi:hypothetical protein